MKVVIVDFQSGNLFSVRQALHLLGVDAAISSSKKDLEYADAVILPGVGSFGDAMKNLEESDLVTPLKEYISSGKPFLGICLGMQLLLSESEEAPGIKGLDMIPGKVVRFRESVKTKVPHIGWSRLRKTRHPWENSFFKNLNEGDFMYFVHSYYVSPEEDEVIFTNAMYDEHVFCSSIMKKNIFATQFHPEKSGRQGLTILKEFAASIRHGNQKGKP